MGQGSKCKRVKSGFTLLEVSIVMVIVIILASMAAPGYLTITKTAHQHLIQEQMLSIHLQQQNFLLKQQRYALESELSIKQSERYEVSLLRKQPEQFVIIAKAKPIQKNNSECDMLTLDHELNKTPAQCW